MTEAVNHTPPRLGIRVSIPPRWRINERTTPEWATTNAAGWMELDRAGGDVGERVRHPGDHRRVRLERRRPMVRLEPARPPQLDLLRRQALPLAGVRLAQPGVDDRVAETQRAGDDGGRLRRPAQVARPDRRELEPSAASSPAVARACSRPSSVSGESAVPCQRRTEFHSLWPCRSTRIGMRPADIPTEGSADSTLGPMAVVRLFAAARDAAGTGRDELPGATVGDVLAAAGRRYGQRFTDVLGTCKIWVNGEPADLQDSVGAADELAVLPPVSGGATQGGRW